MLESETYNYFIGHLLNGQVYMKIINLSCVLSLSHSFFFNFHYNKIFKILHHVYLGGIWNWIFEANISSLFCFKCIYWKSVTQRIKLPSKAKVKVTRAMPVVFTAKKALRFYYGFSKTMSNKTEKNGTKATKKKK